MISITRLNGTKLWISSDEIEFIEATPDSIISMVSGKRVIARETPEELVTKIVEFRRRVRGKPAELLVDKQGKEIDGIEPKGS